VGDEIKPVLKEKKGGGKFKEDAVEESQGRSFKGIESDSRSKTDREGSDINLVGEGRQLGNGKKVASHVENQRGNPES